MTEERSAQYRKCHDQGFQSRSVSKLGWKRWWESRNGISWFRRVFQPCVRVWDFSFDIWQVSISMYNLHFVTLHGAAYWMCQSYDLISTRAFSIQLDLLLRWKLKVRTRVSRAPGRIILQILMLLKCGIKSPWKALEVRIGLHKGLKNYSYLQAASWFHYVTQLYTLSQASVSASLSPAQCVVAECYLTEWKSEKCA